MDDRPPIGIMPRWLHRQKRMVVIADAISRYAEAGADIPEDWMDELRDLWWDHTIALKEEAK